MQNTKCFTTIMSTPEAHKNHIALTSMAEPYGVLIAIRWMAVPHVSFTAEHHIVLKSLRFMAESCVSCMILV